MVNYWLWVAKRGSKPNMICDKKLNWEGCNYETEEGDLALIYRAKPFQRIQFLVRALSDSKLKPNPEDIYNCDFEVLYDFGDKSLDFKSMQNKEDLSDWYPLKIMFMKRNFSIEPKHWRKLREILIKESPKAIDMF
ncbi:hypothetical protein [Methanobacterium formicicum]|uniref:EVE domain-containing protein n=1 Tax=Methanobacterium formicicum TaxID=2162 RepID=A0A843AKU2_METFO|nr:hypothetical protein [Methanobacterium formicicum]MBF4473931.1 hypothetical protein [Methanobacterium formicicum]